jgi:hypothetical protein
MNAALNLFAFLLDTQKIKELYPMDSKMISPTINNT